jgi:NAD(P)H-flavin reductase
VLLILSLLDYLHLTKRLGIVAASQMPLHYLLPLKTPYSPLQLLTQTSYETLLTLHQLLGRIIILFFAAHVALYTNFFVLSSLFATKLTQTYILTGYAAFVSFAVLGTTALSWVRHRNYRLFYILHVTLAFLGFPALWIHVHHIRIYLYQSLAVYMANQVLRALATQRVSARITPVPGSDKLVDIAIPSAGARFTSWRPGNYGYVSTKPGRFILPWARSNPFTLARIPTPAKAGPAARTKRQAVEQVELKFVARIFGGQTRALSALRPDIEHLIHLEGPYGDMLHGDRLLQYDRVLFVAGGIGGTFCSPLYEQLLGELSPSKGSRRRQQVTFLWVARRAEDLSWALPHERRRLEGFAERLVVHITGSSSGDSRDECIDKTIESKKRKIRTSTSNNNNLREGSDAIELEERKILLNAEELATGSDVRSTTIQKERLAALTLRTGRPNLSQAVDQIFAPNESHELPQRVAVVVCGPKSLCQGLRREVGRYADGGREIWFWNEKFGN